MKKSASFFLFCIFLIGVVWANSEEVHGPGWKFVRGTAVSPEEFQAWRQSSVQGVGTMAAKSSSLPSFDPVELTELSKGLQHKPDLIFEHIRNHYDYVPYFGYLKGPFQTYLDRAGNDLDLAALAAALLEKAGYEPEIMEGWMTIPRLEMAAWLKSDADSEVIEGILENSRIPYDFSHPEGEIFIIHRFLVSVMVDGEPFQFDPAFKRYRRIEGIDLGAAMGYDRVALSNAVGGASGTLGSGGWVTELSNTALSTHLSDLATNLNSAIASQHNNATFREIVGGFEVIPGTAPLPPYLWLPIGSFSLADIPTLFFHTVRLEHGAIDETIPTALWAGRKWAITYDEELALPEGMSVPEEEPVSTPTVPAVRENLSSLSFAAETLGELAPPLNGGLVPEGEMALLSTDLFDFGRILPNRAVETMPIPHTNLLTGIQNIQIQITEGSSHYRIVVEDTEYTTYTRTLPPGQTFTYQLRFKGNGAARGTKTGRMTIIASGYQPYALNLTGFVASPLNLSVSQSVAGTYYIGHSESFPFWIRNHDSLPLTITGITLSGNNEFTLTSGSLPKTLSRNQIHNGSLNLTNLLHGTRTGQAYVTLQFDGISYSSSEFFYVVAKGVHQPSAELAGFYFGQNYESTPKDGAVTFKNTGILPVSLTAVTLAGADANHFSIIDGGDAGTIAAGATRTVKVRYLASAVGTHTAEVQFTFTYDTIPGHNTVASLAGSTLIIPLAKLWVDDELVTQEPLGSSGTFEEPLTITVRHPYNGADQSAVYPLKRGAKYVIASDFGSSRWGLALKRAQSQLVRHRNAGLEDSSNEVLTSTLDVMGRTWMQQSAQSNDLLQELADSVLIYHHRFGIVAQEEGYYVDIKNQVISYATRSATNNHGVALFKSLSFFGSALEHGVLEQSQINRPAASTVKILFNANKTGTRIYLMNQSNVDSLVGGTLTNYSAEDLSDFQDRVSDEEIFVLPQDGNIGVAEWEGKGYIGYNPSGSQRSFAMTIGGDYHGGYGGYPVDINTDWVVDNYFPDLFFGAETPHPMSAEPVDLATGAYVYDSVDLELGQAEPRGIRFARHYSSLNADTETTLGFGWDHNWNSYISEYSNADFALGMRRAVDAAAMIAASHVILDLSKQTTTTAKDWLLKTMVAKWGIDEVHENAVAVHINGKVLTYCRQPDGTFTGPPGITIDLVQTANAYELRERFGAIQRFTSIDGTYRLTSWTDVDGKELIVDWSDGQVSIVTDSFARSFTFHYTDESLTSLTDSTGRSISFGYDSDKNLTDYTGPDNHTFEYDYDDRHRIIELRDPDNRIITQNFYNDLNQTWKQMSEGQYEWLFYFSGFRNVERDPLNGEKVYLFDENRLTIGHIDGEGRETTTKFNGQQQPVELKNPRGYLTKYGYDQHQNLIRIERETDGASQVYEFDHDDQHRLVSEIDPRQNEITHSYNAQHRRVSTSVEALNETTSFTYNSDGYLYTETDPGMKSTTYHYDQWGNVNQIDHPGGVSEYAGYNARGDQISSTDPKENTTNYEYNNRRLLTRTTDPAPFSHQTEVRNYDGVGNLVSLIDRREHETTWVYDPLNHMESMTDPYTNTTIYHWDSRDFQTGVTTPLLHRTKIVPDAAGNVVEVIDPLLNPTTFELDANGNVILETNAENEELIYTYDPLDRRTSILNIRDETVFYGYDENGNWNSLTDARPETFTMNHDALNRQIGVSTPGNRSTLIHYNDRGLVESVVKPSSATTTFVYDDAGRIASKTDGVGTTAYTYDDNGNVLTITENGKTITRTYDELNRLTSYTDESENTISYGYDANSNLTSLTYPGGTKTVTYTYDKLDRLKTVTDWNNLVTTYTWDDDGRLTKIERPNDTIRQIDHDAANRVTKIQERNANGILIAYYEFTYDNVGKITQMFSLPKPAGAVIPEFTATYDPDNRLETLNGLAVVHDDDGNMTYGPLTTDDFVTHIYDARNRLTAVDGAGYGYDAEDNRTSITTSEGTTSMVIDPSATLSRMLIRELPDGTKTYYVYGATLLYEVDESDAITTYHYNQIGSTVALVAADGLAITDRADYSSYGTILARTGDTNTPFLYNGAYGVQTDPNGLIQMRARYYNPQIRRFLNADPIGFDGGLNWYLYANGNPVSYVDPNGEFAWIVAGAMIGAAIDAGTSIIGDIAHGRDVNWRNAGAAAVRGAVVGGVSAVAGPLAGTAMKGTGALATGIGSKALSTGITGVGSSIGQVGYNAMIGNDSLLDGVSEAYLLGGVGQGLAGVFPVKGLDTLAQARYFAPRRMSSMLKTKNARMLSGSYFTSSLVGGVPNLLK